MSGTQETWAGALGRLASILGGGSEQFRVEAEEWLREAVASAYGVESLYDLTRTQRQVAFQRTLVVANDLAGEGEIAFLHDLRRVVASAFAARFECGPLAGPEWRMSPVERDRPTYREVAALADFA